MIKWDDTLTCFDKSTDDAHKEIFNRYNILVECLADDKDHATIKEQALYLIDFMLIHFHDENIYMKKQKYPYANEHIIEHAKYMKIMTDMLLSVANDPNDPLSHIEVLTSFALVVEEHVKKTDMKFIEFMQEKHLLQA